MVFQAVNGSETNSVPDISRFNGSSDFILTPPCESPHLIFKRSKSYKQAFKNIFTLKTLLRRLPILKWLPRYNLEQGIGDLIAGLTVGMTVIPQGLAYAGVAGLASEVCINNQLFTIY